MIISKEVTFSFAKKTLLLFALLINGLFIHSQQIAFPEAEGFGKFATGGRGGQVIKVTNLNDNGPGSLRQAIELDIPRIVVFEVSGTIYLKSRLKISNNNITIAGQTAPGHGITLAHFNFYIEAENVIVRHIRSRLSAGALQQEDAITCKGSENVIIDHCSFSWSVDEVASIYHNKKLTMQHCIIGESFHHSIHDKGAHGYGGIWGGDSVSFHHNLIMHNTSRNPRLHGARWYSNWHELVDFRNNVIYNWKSNTIYGGERSEIDGSPTYYNLVNNYYKYGPATASSIKDRIIDPDPDPTYGYGEYYINGNYVYEFPDVTEDNWLGVDNITEEIKDSIKRDTPFAYDITTIHTAEEAYEYVIQHAGSNIPFRDTIDSRMLWEVANDTALYGGLNGANTGIVDNLENVGGYPDLFSNWAAEDSDGDAMPDFWEIANGLNPNDPSDVHTILEDFTYPAIEEYINSIEASTETFMHQPTDAYAELTDIKEISIWWKDNTNDETAFLLWRSDDNEFTCIDTLDANTTYCTDTNILFNKTYTYKVQAINSNDSSVYSNDAIAETLGEDGRPNLAKEPNPAHGASNISSTAKLSWKSGVGTSSHKVYFGTSYPPPYITTVYENNYTASNLDYNTRYYWRIDEANENGATEGEIWNFMTRNEIPQALIAHFAFDKAIVVDDISGNGITGTPHNIGSANFVDGVSKKALQFDGSTQYCEYEHNNKFNFDINPFSISFWINQDLATVNKEHSHRYIVKGSNMKNVAEDRSGKRFEVYYTPNKNIVRFCVDDDEVKSEVTADENYFLKNEWVHVVAIRDTTSKKLRIYANTELVGEVDDQTGNIAQDENMFISYCVDEDGYVDGTMDEVQLYGYSLSDDDINSLYQGIPISNTQTFKNSAFNIYPNPSHGILNISKQSHNNVNKVEAYNVLGQKIFEANQNTISDLNQLGYSSLNINYNKENTNLIFLIIKTDSNTIVKKLLMQ